MAYNYIREPLQVEEADRLCQSCETMQMNQAITFLADGGDTVRDLQLYLSPQAEHILDWFHVTMRITVMKQFAVSLLTDGTINITEELDSLK